MNPGALPLAGAEADLLAIRLGDATVAVAAWCVSEILDDVVPRPLPEAPADVEGIATIRNAAIPLVDLRRRMALPADSRGLVLLVRPVEASPPVFALRVDGVAALWHVALSSIEPPPAAAAIGAAARFFLGVVAHGGESALVFDLPEILATAERLSLQDLIDKLQEPPA